MRVHARTVVSCATTCRRGRLEHKQTRAPVHEKGAGAKQAAVPTSPVKACDGKKQARTTRDNEVTLSLLLAYTDSRRVTLSKCRQKGQGLVKKLILFRLLSF